MSARVRSIFLALQNVAAPPRAFRQARKIISSNNIRTTSRRCALSASQTGCFATTLVASQLVHLEERTKRQTVYVCCEREREERQCERENTEDRGLKYTIGGYNLLMISHCHNKWYTIGSEVNLGGSVVSMIWREQQDIETTTRMGRLISIHSIHA